MASIAKYGSLLGIVSSAFRSISGPSLSQSPISRFLLPTLTIPIPRILEDVWDSVLRAVPKKKTSHMKKRHRQMAGKALQDVTALNKCSACGRTKRAHILCPHCVESVQRLFSAEAKAKSSVSNQTAALPRASAGPSQPTT